MLLIDSCGAVIDRTVCTGSDICARSHPTLSSPNGANVCQAPCYYLNGTQCSGSNCTACYYTSSPASKPCCGLCNGVHGCTSL